MGFEKAYFWHEHFEFEWDCSEEGMRFVLTSKMIKSPPSWIKILPRTLSLRKRRQWPEYRTSLLAGSSTWFPPTLIVLELNFSTGFRLIHETHSNIPLAQVSSTLLVNSHRSLLKVLMMPISTGKIFVASTMTSSSFHQTRGRRTSISLGSRIMWLPVRRLAGW